MPCLKSEENPKKRNQEIKTLWMTDFKTNPFRPDTEARRMIHKGDKMSPECTLKSECPLAYWSKKTKNQSSPKRIQEYSYFLKLATIPNHK